MKLINETRTLVSTSNLDSAAFEISQIDSKVIMGMLAEGIYTDKVLAVLREYAANAWDAHRMVGKGDVPIKVTLPTRSSPVLKIRDFGPGLSHEDVKTVYCKYGRSTKRATNEAVGMLGIGSKSAFAYADTFTVTSYHGGTQSTWVAVQDDSESESMGKISLFGECPTDETGIEVAISVRPEDVYEFETKAKALFRHFSPRPEINIQLPPPPDEQTVLKNGTITQSSYYGSEWIAIMGCVPYKVTLTQLDLTKIASCLPNLSGSLFFDIGEVQVSTSREELKYSTATKAKLVQKFNDLVDEYVIHALEDLDQPGVTAWDKRIKVQILDKLGLPLPEEYKALAFLHAKITYAPGTFVILHGSSPTTRITVNGRTRLLLDDTGKTLANYNLNSDDYIVRGDGKTLDEVRVLLEQALTDSGLTGVQIGVLSDLPWNAPYVKGKKAVNPKHKAKMFALAADHKHFAAPYSDHWEMVNRIPLDTDVYVLISGFTAYQDFFVEFKADKKLLEHFGEVMPAVYGYKTSDKKPATGMSGTEYRVWREGIVKMLLTPENLQKIEEHFWENPVGGYGYWPDDEDRQKIAGALGATHAVVAYFERQAAAKEDHISGLLADRAGIERRDSEAYKAAKVIKDSYPLLRDESIRNLWGSWNNNPEDWFEYIRLVDERNARNAAQPVVLSMVP
jgi:hypothetical protein